MSVATRSAGRHPRTRIVRWFEVATHAENWVLKSAGEVNDRPGRKLLS